MVDLAFKEGTKYQSPSPRLGPGDRRISERLGCTIRSQTSSRSMVPSSDGESHHISGAHGGLSIPPALDIADESAHHCSADRQHYGRGGLGEGGRYAIKGTVRIGSEDSELCSETSDQSTDVLPTRTVEHGSRVDAEPCPSKNNFQTVQTASDRPVCITEVEAGVQILHVRSPRSQSIGYGWS